MVATYFSVLTPTPATASQNIVFTFMPTNATSNVAQTVTVNLTSSQSELAVAQSIASQLVSFFTTNGTLWAGQPPLSSSTPTNTFQVTITDHVICVWSDCTYNVNVVNNSSIQFVWGPDPCFLTIADLQNRAPIHRLVLQDLTGQAFGPATIATVIQDSSAALIAYLNNPIVATSYMDSYRGAGGKMLKGRYRPGLSWDVPTSRQMWQLVANTLATNPRD